MFKGTAPAEYGGRISSVLDVKMNDGNNHRIILVVASDRFHHV
jgi:hypothetical protein